jgi:hypothetical protein
MQTLRDKNNCIYFMLETSVVTWFSARNGGFTAAGIADINKVNGRVALHTSPNITDLKPAKLVCEDIKNRVASMNLNEMQIF